MRSNLFLLILFLVCAAAPAWAVADHHYFYDPMRLGGTDIMPSTNLDVGGSVRLGNGGETCNSTNAGGLRWNGTNFQGCDGSAWNTFGSGAGLTGTASTTSISAGNSSVVATDTGTDGTITFTTEGVNRGNIGHLGNWKLGPSGEAVTKMEVAGSVKIGNGGETCNSTYVGSLRYNSSTALMELCNGTAWVSVRPTATPIGSGHIVDSMTMVNGCMGSMLFDISSSGGTTATATSYLYEYNYGYPHGLTTGDTITISGATPTSFNGTYTVTVVDQYTFTYTKSVAETAETPFGDFPSFCRSPSGMAAANAICVRALTSDTNWRGYTSANAASLLNSTKIKAFLCDGSSCNNLTPNTNYYFSTVGDPDSGGGYFKTNSAGLGPGDEFNAHFFSGTSWGDTAHISSGARYWTGRGPGSETLWPASPGPQTCNSWTSGSYDDGGIVGSASAGRYRWNGIDDNGPETCDSVYDLICIVNP